MDQKTARHWLARRGSDDSIFCPEMPARNDDYLQTTVGGYRVDTRRYDMVAGRKLRPLADGAVYQSILHAPESDKYVLYERTIIDDPPSFKEALAALFVGGPALKDSESPKLIYMSLAPLGMMVWSAFQPGLFSTLIEILVFALGFVALAAPALDAELVRRSEGVHNQHVRIFDSRDDLRDALDDTKGLPAKFQPDVLR